MLLLPVVVPGAGVVVVEAGGVVVAGGTVAGGACATCAAAALWLGGTVWSSRSAAYEAPTAPARSRAVRPKTVIAERAPGRVPIRPAAVPHARHQSCPGSIVAPQDLHVRAPGSTAGSSRRGSAGGGGGGGGGGPGGGAWGATWL